MRSDFGAVRLVSIQCCTFFVTPRQGIKEYSNWPTIPQLYVNGEFVGGSDIMTDMYQKGELQRLGV